jgi:glutamate formiminotransferase/formiminotetrahydrofolate cyclodeaminase
MRPLVECVPNFSEGRNEKVINAIADAIRGVAGVKLLDVDPGFSTNRTVVTLVGSPDEAVEAAFQGIARASQLIDMRKHHGEHPRMGATDVCPFVPVSGLTMADCVELAKKLGERVGRELGIPVYLYSAAAATPERESLADIRQGEYEALAEKMKAPSFKPDFGPSAFNAEAGATVIGARPFLIAYNVNLNTRSKKLANEIALNIREAGRAKRTEDGAIAKNDKGEKIMVPGRLKEVRAVGWYVDEYERAQVSINLTNFEVTSMHEAFDVCCEEAAKLGLRVTGSEIVGLVPLKAMLDAGRYYLAKQKRSTGVSEAALVECAVQSLGLADLSPFNAREKIIDYCVEESGSLLRDMTVSAFVDELASDSAAPGGGSAAALCGALSASLSTMVAALTFDKKGFESAQKSMDELASRGQVLKKELLGVVDSDRNAFNQIIDARRLPKGTDAEKLARDEAITAAERHATDVPLALLKAVPDLLELADAVVESGNPNSLSDAGVAALSALAAAEGAYYNVLINLQGFKGSDSAIIYGQATKAEATMVMDAVRTRAEAIRQKVLGRLLSAL